MGKKEVIRTIKILRKSKYYIMTNIIRYPPPRGINILIKRQIYPFPPDPAIFPAREQVLIRRRDTGAGVPQGASRSFPSHVLHNKQEFPLATGVEDLLALSISSGSSATAFDGARTPMPTRFPLPREVARITADHIWAGRSRAGLSSTALGTPAELCGTADPRAKRPPVARPPSAACGPVPSTLRRGPPL